MEVGGIYWGWISRSDERSEATPQTRFERLVHDPNAGDTRVSSPYVQTNEAIALRFGSDRRGPGYLIHRRNRSSYHPAWQKASRFNPATRNPDIYQWQTRNSNRRTTDRRRLDVVEEQIYSLSNERF